MLEALNDAVPIVKTTVRKTLRFLGSQEAVAILKVGIAAVTLFQAVDAFRDSRRKIGFKKE